MQEEEQEHNINKDEVVDYNSQYYSRPPLGKGQKIAVAVLAFFSLFVVIAWIMQFKQSISGPNDSAVADYSSTDTDSGAVNTTKDTDGDGLTDYDEINEYKTSPYLEDSDSDGFSDKKEIDSGKDPNCPTGMTCTAVTPAETADTTTSDTAQDVVDPSQATVSTGANANASNPAPLGVSSSTANTADLQKVLTGDVDAKTLRKTLLDSGMEKAVLDKISDDDLMASYKETLKK